MTASPAQDDVLADLIERARKAGADQADGVMFEGVSISHAQRLAV